MSNRSSNHLLFHYSLTYEAQSLSTSFSWPKNACPHSVYHSAMLLQPATDMTSSTRLLRGISYWLKQTIQCTLSLFLAVTSSGTVANDSHVWFLAHYPCNAFMASCISWSSLLNHLTDGISFSLYCCWLCFVLSKTVLQFLTPSLSTHRVWPVI